MEDYARPMRQDQIELLIMGAKSGNMWNKVPSGYSSLFSELSPVMLKITDGIAVVEIRHRNGEIYQTTSNGPLGHLVDELVELVRSVAIG